MIANRECACGRGVAVLGGLVNHAEPKCTSFVEAARSPSTLGAYVDKCSPLELTPIAKAASNRLCEASFRRRAAIIGALQSCICEWPLKRADTSTHHDELCPAHETILQTRAIREREIGGLSEQIQQLRGPHCPLNCACRFVDVALHGGV